MEAAVQQLQTKLQPTRATLNVMCAVVLHLTQKKKSMGAQVVQLIVIQPKPQISPQKCCEAFADRVERSGGGRKVGLDQVRDISWPTKDGGKEMQFTLRGLKVKCSYDSNVDVIN